MPTPPLTDPSERFSRTRFLTWQLRSSTSPWMHDPGWRQGISAAVSWTRSQSSPSPPCFPTVGLSMWCPPSLQRIPSVVGGVTVRTEEALGRLGGTPMTTNGAPRRPGSGDRGFAESSGGSEMIPNADSVSETVTVNRLRRVLQAGRRMEPQSRAGEETLNLLISRIKLRVFTINSKITTILTCNNVWRTRK